MEGNRLRGARLAFGIAAVAFALFGAASVAAAANPQIGTKDQSFSGASTAPSGSKPESKLWFNDARWWAVMWDTTSSSFHIFRADAAGLSWQNTGTTVDTRGSTRSDALWDGSHLYIASHDVASDSSHNTANRPARLYRFSYSAGSATYSLDAGFPITILNVSTETFVIEKDSTGTLWATWTQARRPYVAHSTVDDKTWTAGFILPVSGVSLNADDISSLVAVGGNRIGVMWSNQADSHMYFSTHQDGASDATWTASEAATSGSGSADDHINLKTDSAGRVYAAVKTSLTSSSATLTQLLVRGAGGGWTASRFGTVADSHTRPIVLIDEQHGIVHMFATGKWPGSGSGQSGGTIYEKTAPIGSISFSSGSGTAFIQDPNSGDLNNATSTKQGVSGSTGLIVLATNDSTKFYWHATSTLGAPGPTPVSDFSANVTSGTAPLTVQFTDLSTNSPNAWAWDFGDNGTSSVKNPSHQYTSAGTYTVKLTASNANGTGTTATKTGYITVTAPGPTPVSDFSANVTSGTAPLTVQFTDLSTNSPNAWAWDFGDNGTSGVQNPSHQYTSAGTYTVKLTASNANGTGTTATKTGYITVSSAGPTPVSDFSANVTSGVAPLTVQFTDLSTNSPNAWAWDFGDNGTSGVQNPSHQYTSAGTYTVKLTASNTNGTGTTATKTGYITVTSLNPTTLTFNPIADAHVNTSNVNGNYGTLTTLKVREGDGSSANPNYHGYLKFSLSGVTGTVSSVKLRLYVTDPTSDLQSVFVVTDDSWTETGITYTNAPPLTGSAVGSSTAPTVGAYLEITLTPTTVSSSTTTLSLGLKSAGGNSAIFSSREDPTNKPQLTVTFQ
jgi:PKD repeat protein